ncbi:hypothetical protein JCGZ_02445 [Jatropha curcas]|uniref:Uncharacterized protein n=1 Tax=Jatropha curcas TaxID=180498 RepID=A0A067L581_JATCU|nr:hypothetical protein JCGZ_02445 [Jatropha curcas]
MGPTSPTCVKADSSIKRLGKIGRRESLLYLSCCSGEPNSNGGGVIALGGGVGASGEGMVGRILAATEAADQLRLYLGGMVKEEEKRRKWVLVQRKERDEEEKRRGLSVLGREMARACFKEKWLGPRSGLVDPCLFEVLTNTGIPFLARAKSDISRKHDHAIWHGLGIRASNLLEQILSYLARVC